MLSHQRKSALLTKTLINLDGHRDLSCRWLGNRTTMAGSWNNFPHSFGMYPSYYTTAQDPPQFTPTAGYYGNVLPFQQPVLDRLQTGLPDFDDLNRSVLPAQGANRIRRRVNAGGEHVKFRRTRSGCYTCRNRRVKVHALFEHSPQRYANSLCSVMRLDRFVSVS